MIIILFIFSIEEILEEKKKKVLCYILSKEQSKMKANYSFVSSSILGKVVCLIATVAA